MSPTVLVERSFEVGVPLDRTWALLSTVERWPEWAAHIRTASLDSAPLGPESEGRFTFRPVGSARFRVTTWRPPVSWTWHGRALGLPIDYHHGFDTIDDQRTRLTWTVELCAPDTGIRARAFARTYSRNLDRAWPKFVTWAEAHASEPPG